MVNTIALFTQPPAPAGYGFSNTASALLYFAPMIGTVLAEFWGHWFNDWLSTRYIKKHGGKYKPENRLWGVYPPWIIGIIGLITFGETLQNHAPWIGLAFGWGMTCFSTLGVTVAISSYILDVFPQHAALASAWINTFRTVGKFCFPPPLIHILTIQSGGFSVSYFQLKWATKSGPAITFGSQAAIVGFFVISIILTQWQGPKWRKRFPAPATSRTY